MAVETTSQERIERLKALLVGESTSRRARAALASAPDKSKNLLLGVMLHGANRLRWGMPLTQVEQILVDALKTVIDTEEVKEWGRAYRQTVETADREKLIVPWLIAARQAMFGYTLNDLKAALPQLAQEASEAPNVSVVSLEDLAAGRIEEDEAFVEAMRETGFAVTGTRTTRYPSENSNASAEDASAAQTAPAAEVEPWRVQLDMDGFYVERAVGDQWGGRDEIYFTAASGVGGGAGETFVSQEFGGLGKGDSRDFSDGKKTFLNQRCGGGPVVTSIQVWEADQSNAEWYDKLQLALQSAVEMIDDLERNPMTNFLPVPDPVAFGWEIAKVFIGLMDVLRNHDDLSCSRTFVLTRDDMAVLSYRRELEWNFNGDGHHKLTVRYEGDRPSYPIGSIHYVFRSEEDGAWSAPVPLGWKTRSAPRAMVHDDVLHVLYANPDTREMTGSWYDGTAWDTWGAFLVTEQPAGLVVRQETPFAYAADYDDGCLTFTHWVDTTGVWSGWTGKRPELDTAVGPALATHRDKNWIVRACYKNGRHALVLTAEDDETGDDEKVLTTADHAFGAPSMAHGLGRTWVTYRLDGQLFTMYTDNDERPDRASWSSPVSRRPSDHDPAMHFDGQTLWLAHTVDGTPFLSRRTRVTNSDPGEWSSPLPLGGETPPTVLGTPGLATCKGRLYAFYHA